MYNPFIKKSRYTNNSKIYEFNASGKFVESQSFIAPVCQYCQHHQLNFELGDVTVWCCPKEECIDHLSHLNPAQWREYPMNFILHLKKRNEFCSAKLDGNDPIQEDFINKWKLFKQGKIRDIYLSGDLGIGKTHCLIAALKDVCKYAKNMTTCLITEADLYKKIKNSWEKYSDESEKKLIDHYSTVDILFLDDLAAAIKTSQGDWGNQLLLDLLDERLNSLNLRTVISSNYTMDQLSGIYNERILDRLKKMKCAYIHGPSRRMPVEQIEMPVESTISS